MMKHLKTYKKFYESIGSPLLDLSDNVDTHLISLIEKTIKRGSSILEISCGNGADSLHLQELGYRVTCTELNPEYVKNAQDLGLDCIQHDTKNQFPFSDGEFDLVYSRLGLHYFTEDELNSIFSELQRIGKKILITVKIVDDIKTGKVILTSDKWNEIISKYFNIKIFEIKEGILYGSQSKWIEISGDSLGKAFESTQESVDSDLEDIKDIMSDISDFEDNIEIRIDKINTYYLIQLISNTWPKGHFRINQNIISAIQMLKRNFKDEYHFQYRYWPLYGDSEILPETDFSYNDEDGINGVYKEIYNSKISRIKIIMSKK
jgi:SAM-dependent methyltransferase